MKKKAFVKKVTEELSVLDYRVVPGNSIAAALFFKKLRDLILTLGLEISSLYEQGFTGSFNLSRSFLWAFRRPDYPFEAYKRIGAFLLPDERQELLDSKYCKPGIIDAWWSGFEPDSINSFVKAVGICEPRFLAQPGLLESIWHCAGMEFHAKMLREVAKYVGSLEKNPDNLIHQPTALEKAIPANWYWAAELVLCNYEPDLVNKKYVSQIAIDAWRVANL